MAESQVGNHSTRKQIRQPPSVPFLWEEKPGIPKKDWKPEGFSLSPTTPPAPPPVKFVASVPFTWEEKPGKPLPCFSSTELISFPSPPLQSHAGHNDKDVKFENGGNDDGVKFELDLEAFGFETDESFSSAPSLLANCLVSSLAISTAVPVDSLCSANDTSDQPETPSSPASEADSSTSSYATGTSSLVGASFLECLFPLNPPRSGFLDKVGHSEKGSITPPQARSKDFDRESNCSVVVARRTTTLGELIMMSRRMSHRRKAVQMRKHNQPMEFMKSKAFGCFIFRTSIKLIERLQGTKFRPKLKLF